MAIASDFKLVDSKSLFRIHEATLEVLADTGIVFRSEEALEIFRRHNARVEGQTVHISQSMLRRALESAPEGFGLEARNPERSIYVGEGQERVHVSLNNGPVHVQDQEGGRRLGTLADLINFYKLGQYSQTCSIVGQIPVDPSDLKGKWRDLEIFRHLLQHTDKPVFGYVGTQKEIGRMFDMMAIAYGGGDPFKDKHLITVSLNPLSPLKYDEIPCETLLAYAKRRQPVMVLTCAMAGVTAPIKALGTVVLQNAEILAGLVLTQLVNPGTPFVYSPASAMPNMRTAGYVTGMPVSNMINMIGIQLAKELYSLPTRCMAGLTDSKTVDCQAGYETMQNYLMLMMAGVHMINECFGLLDSIMTVSYEKFIIDDELLERTACLLQGLDVSEEAFSVDVINSVAHNGSYLTHPSTLQGCRHVWEPKISFMASYSDWEKAGCPDIVTRAGQRVKKILAECPDSMLDPEIERALQAYLDSVQD
jgi:trimethylamine--corrinoid protein Co-methyltransferase